jgi:type IV secretion system protein VirD4
VLALFFQQAIGLQTRVLPEHDPKLKYQVMMMLDEFSALGRIPIIAESVSYLPGYNVRVVLVIQTPAQLREVYGANAAEAMLKSLAARVVFAPKDVADARDISDELGFTTVKVKTFSKPLFAFSTHGQRHRSVNESEQRRALLLPQEVQMLGPEQAIIFYEGLRPIRCRKIRYFSDRRFKARLLAPPVQTIAPAVDIASPERARAPKSGEAAGAPAATPETPGTAGEAAETVREATAADVERLESLTLEDFAADFSNVVVPEGSPMSDPDMNAAVTSFLASLREQ